MANTWQCIAPSAAYAANKHMIDVFNATASTRFIRIYRAYAFNNLYAAVTGVLNTHRVHILSTSVSAGTAVTPQAHDSTNSALNANTTSGSGRTTTIASTLRQILTSNDESSIGSLDWDSMGTLVPFADIWNAGYGDSNVQPITLAASENRGFSILSVTQAVGVGDYEISFTDAAS